MFGHSGSSLLLRVFSIRGEQGLLSSCGVWASHCGGASRWGAQAYSTQAPLAGAGGPRSRGSRAPEHRLRICGKGLSCSAACGIFPDQGLNLCLLHWQVDSLSLNHQGSPEKLNFKKVRITQRWVWFYTIQYIPFFVCLVGSGRLHENHSLFEQFEVSGVSTRCLETCAVQGRSHLWPFNTWEWSWSNLKHAIRLVTDFEGFLWKKESKISL